MYTRNKCTNVDTTCKTTESCLSGSLF